MDADLTPLTVDPELKRKWNRLLQLDAAVTKALHKSTGKRRKLGAKINELNELRRDLNVN